MTNDPQNHTQDSNPQPETLRSPRSSEAPQAKLTVASGGWVLILMALICVALVTWAVWPALQYQKNRPPGDNEHIESYGFDLSNLELDRNLTVPALLHRDMMPTMDTATYLSAAEVNALTGRDKYLVSSDRVVGVTINGEHRAYPILLLNVHEIIHDTLGGIPIAVTYNWPCDSVMVFDRRIESQPEPLYFAHSGLAYNSNAIYYDRRPDDVGESLWVQLLGRAVSGPLKGATLRTIDYQLTDWGTWTAAWPQSTVVRRDPQYIKRYEKSSPDTYFLSEDIPFDDHTAPLPETDAIALKARVYAVRRGDQYTVFPLPWLIEQMDDGKPVRLALGEGEIIFDVNIESHTAWVTAQPADAIDGFVHALWFAWHAMHPEAQVYEEISSK